MQVTYATSNEKVQEHLCEMMERLLDDELFKDKKTAMVEIEKARAMSNLVESSLQIQKVEIQQNQLKVDAMQLLIRAGYDIESIKNFGIELGNSIGKKNAKNQESLD